MTKLLLSNIAAAATVAAAACADRNDVSEPRGVFEGKFDGDRWIESETQLRVAGAPLWRVIVDSRVASPLTGGLRHEPLAREFAAARRPSREEFLAAADADEKEVLL